MCVPGEAVYEACVSRVESFLYKKLLKVSEAAQLNFFLLSFFYDRAVDLQLLRTIKVLSYLILKMRTNEKSSHLHLVPSVDKLRPSVVAYTSSSRRRPRCSGFVPGLLMAQHMFRDPNQMLNHLSCFYPCEGVVASL